MTPESFADLWNVGSIPWVEIIMILVVLNFLLLSGGSTGKGFMAWLNKISHPKPKNARAKKAASMKVSAARKRSARTKEWGKPEAAPAGTFKVSGKRSRANRKKGWDIGGATPDGSFNLSNARKRSSQKKGWELSGSAASPAPPAAPGAPPAPAGAAPDISEGRKRASRNKGGHPAAPSAGTTKASQTKGKSRMLEEISKPTIRAAKEPEKSAAKASGSGAEAPARASSSRKQSSGLRIGRRSARGRS